MKKEKTEKKAKALHRAADRCLRVLLEEASPDPGAVAEKTGLSLEEAQAMMMNGPTQLADWLMLWLICLEEYDTDKKKLAATLRILEDRDEFDEEMGSFLASVVGFFKAMAELELRVQGKTDA